jgi:hypothetical protein
MVVRSFDDMASLESGDAREFIPSELMSPPESWWQCRVRRANKSHFVMELEKNANGTHPQPMFVLSARRVGDDFYISRYESFPASCGAEGNAPLSGFCAVVRGVGAGVGSKSKAGERRTFDLVPATMGLPTASALQPLATMSHSWFKQPNCGAEVRTVDASLLPSGSESLFVWDHGRHSRPLSQEDDADAADGGGAPTKGAQRIGIASQIPRWDSGHGCLVMKFQRQRVKESSSKNFILFLANEAGRGSANGNVDPSTAVMQFGKAAEDEYVLDLRSPVAPLHAFALALSSFAFRV